MGLHLTLLPFWGKDFSDTLLRCVDRRELFEEIKKLTAERVPTYFESHLSSEKDIETTHYGNTQSDQYGDILTCLTVAELLKLAAHEAVLDNSVNRAIWAYIKELPSDTKVALYWG